MTNLDLSDLVIYNLKTPAHDRIMCQDRINNLSATFYRKAPLRVAVLTSE